MKSYIVRASYWVGVVLFALTIVNTSGNVSIAKPVQQPAAISTPIKHIVFIIKENRTFDNYFGLFPGVNGASTGKIKTSTGVQTIPLNSLPDSTGIDYCHEWSCAHTAVDGGKMDAFNNHSCNTPPYPCYATAKSTLIPNYWALASRFVLNDNAYSSEVGASFVNHLFTVAGASGLDQAHSAITNPKRPGGGDTLLGM